MNTEGGGILMRWFDRAGVLMAALVVSGIVAACGGGENVEETAQASPWERVQTLLAESDDIMVLDGTELASLSYTGTSEPVFGDWLVRHFLSDPENYNPFTSNDAGASTVQDFILESLLYSELDPPYELKGHLAKEYPTISDDHLSYSFELREDVTFSDGQPMTAADVIFSVKVIKHPGVLAPHLRNYFAAITDVQRDGDSRVRFVCGEPYFRNDLVIGGMLRIIPRHYYDPDGLLDNVSVSSLMDGTWETAPTAELANRFAERFNRDFNQKILGSGPYVIEDWDRDVVTGQKVVLTRNPDYWGYGKTGQPIGNVDKIVFNIINNTDAAFIELTNGNLDLYSLRPLEFKDKSWSPEFTSRLLKGIEYSSGYTYIGWNNAHPIFKDVRIRKAMTYLTDRAGMVRDLLFGLGETVEGPIHKFRPEYNHDLKPYDFDPERALDLIEEAGWADTDGDGILDKEIDGVLTPFKFEFLVNSGNQMRKDIALVVQGELQDIGIACEVRELDWSIFLERVTKSKDFAACTLGWTGSLRFPPDGYQIWHSSQAESGGSNHIGFKNEEVDRILEEYRRTFDAEKRIEMYRRFQEILHAAQPYTFLWKQRTARAYSKRFQGVEWYKAGFDEREWWVDRADRMYE